MRVVAPEDIKDKKVLLRMDLDVPLGVGGDGRRQVVDDFRLKAGLPTLKLCLEHSREVVVMGHIGRPVLIGGQVDEKSLQELSVAPIYDWLEDHGLSSHMGCLPVGQVGGKLKVLENLRFEEGESFDGAFNKDTVLKYAKSLASFGEIYINEAFAAYHEAASTTVLPTLLPHFAGLHFGKEVETLTRVRENPPHPLVVIIGGAKISDKLPLVRAMAQISDAVLVGGKVAAQVKVEVSDLKHHVLIGKLNQEGTDVTLETVLSWENLIKGAKMIVWNGPLGKVEEEESAKGTSELARMILNSQSEVVLGGGDTIGFLKQAKLLDKFTSKAFISTGGGAMLKFLTEGTLPTIEALKN